MSSLKLTTTKIGKLLLENKIACDDGKNSIDNVELRIPEYQRPYKWSAKNANQLLDDIFDAMMSNKDVYRVGTLILHNDKDNKDVYNIVDGQQRTITFSLILACFYGMEKIRFLNEKLALNDINVQNVINNYRALNRRIKNICKDDKDKRALQEYDSLREYIRKNCELIVVITDDQTEAFQFFDSQNARGKALYPHDLLKAYHLREMGELSEAETKDIVKMWEELNQRDLSRLFNEYLYRLREWIKDSKSYELNEQNIDLFKGVSARDQHPYAQYYKGAYAFAEDLNSSKTPFVTGLKLLSPFQIDAPIIAGKPFFQYSKHYFDVLADIRNNDKYEGYFINDNEIVKTLDKYYKSGVGNGITRQMFDTAILLYVDRFCPGIPSKYDLEYLDQFTVYAFIWAYSMRAQYKNVGWLVAQNYIMGISEESKGIINSFNIYKVVSGADSPRALMSILSDKIYTINESMVKAQKEEMDIQDTENIWKNYLHFFKEYHFWEEDDVNK